MSIIGTFTVTADDERLDRIAKDINGSERAGAVERLLAGNPGLAAIGAFEPRGTTIVVPDAPAIAANPAYVRPWE